MGGWIGLANELERIARVKPVIYNENDVPSIRSAREQTELLLMDLPWDKVYDFCERLYASLAIDVTSWPFMVCMASGVVAKGSRMAEQMEAQLLKI